MSASTPKFSIVVPMYNVESYLPKCVESIRCQTLSDIEIILVDDGSPDRCGEMADEYVRQDARIKVVHRINGGLGPARNSGMEIAAGEYVGFVDSDDWVEPDMFERLYEAAHAESADVVFTGLKTVSHGEASVIREHPYAGETLHGQNEIFPLRAAFYGALPARIPDDPTPVSVCLAGYRNAFLKANKLTFCNVRSEDKFFNTHACRAANTVACVSGAPYCYRKDDQPSITKTFNRKTIDSFFRLFRLLELLADEEPNCFWNECHLRARRCVIDYSRVLVSMIEESSEDDTPKSSYVGEVLRHGALRRALKGYPWWKLPAQQGVFYLALKFESVGAVRTLLRLKRRLK